MICRECLPLVETIWPGDLHEHVMPERTPIFTVTFGAS